jgi:hypothetical protein
VLGDYRWGKVLKQAILVWENSPCSISKPETGMVANGATVANNSAASGGNDPNSKLFIGIGLVGHHTFMLRIQFSRKHLKRSNPGRGELESQNEIYSVKFALIKSIPAFRDGVARVVRPNSLIVPNNL